MRDCIRAGMSNMKHIRLLCLIALVLGAAYPRHSVAQDTHRLRSDLGISFAYRDPWKPAVPVESATIHVVNWNAKKGGLIATCYLQQFSGGLGNLAGDEVHSSQNAIVEGLLAKTGDRASVVKLVSASAVYSDGVPMIQVVIDTEIKNLDGIAKLRAWGLYTSWKGFEIHFECGSSAFVPEAPQNVRTIIEASVFEILKTLHFERY